MGTSASSPSGVHWHLRMRVAAIVLCACGPVPVLAQFNTELSPRTAAAFEQYRRSAEEQFTWKARYAQIRPGEVRIEPGKEDGSIGVPDGIVHDWVAGTLVRNAAAARAIGILQDYAHYKNIYAPEILDGKVLSNSGNHWRVWLKIQKTKVISVVLNGEFDVEYDEVAPGRWTVVSRSARLAEVDGNRELPVGKGYGFLWNLNAYWLIEQRPDGAYLECRTLSLSRNVPFLLAPIIRPFISGVPRESLQKTMEATARALRAETPAVAE